MAVSPEKGAETILYLATAAEVAGVSGRYFVHSQAIESSPASYNQTAARRLWQISEQLTGLPVTGSDWQ